MFFKRSFFIIAVMLSYSLTGAYIGYLYPAGGRAGEEVEILVGGQALGGVREAIVTGGGVKTLHCENVWGVSHPSGSQRRYLDRWIRQIVRGDRSFLPLPAGENGTIDWRYHPWYGRMNELTPLQFELVTRFLYVPGNSLQMSPSIGKNVILKLKIDKNARPGKRELRLKGGNWVSNPMPFYVGKVPEFKEPRFQPPFVPKERGTFVWPCVLNGQIMPGETDQFDFEAKKGDVIYFDLKGRSLLPFVGDGVPGHFQAVLEVKDAEDRQVAFADDRYFHPDPVMKFQVPVTGKYRLFVRDALYRGRNDFVYRIEIDKNPRPYIIDAPPVFAVAPVTLSKGGKWGVLSLPTVISSAISKPGEKGVYCFSAGAGERVVADVWARRLNSPLDGLLEIYAPSGKRIAVCDDVKRQKIGTIMQHTDPTILFTAPETGVYKAVLSDNAGAGGKDYKYYLRLDVPRPDFRIYGHPSALEVPGRGIMKVVVERYDGFNGPVTLKLNSRDGYVLCGEKTVPAGVDQATFTLESFRVRKGGVLNLELYGSGNGLTRRVVPATEAMQAFAYDHLILAQGDFYVSRNGKYWSSGYYFWKNHAPAALKLYPGSQTQLRIGVRTKNLPPDFAVTDVALMDQPTGVLIENVKYVPGEITATLKVTADAKPVKVNQVFVITGKNSYKHRDKVTKKVSTRFRNSTGILPARRLIVEVPGKK